MEEAAGRALSCLGPGWFSWRGGKSLREQNNEMKKKKEIRLKARGCGEAVCHVWRLKLACYISISISSSSAQSSVQFSATFVHFTALRWQ